MSNRNSNQINVLRAHEAMDRFKMQAAQEVGVNLTNGYNGHLTSREAGSVGGQMVKVVSEYRYHFRYIEFAVYCSPRDEQNYQIALLLAAVMLLSLAACGAKQPQSTGGQTESNEKSDTSVSNPFANVEIKTSPDKYTWYIKNYVGKNLASIGYTSMGGDRMDSYGNGYIQLILRTPNGEYVDIHNEDDLKNWRVIGQSMEPNTEIKYTYQVDSDGEEYDNLIAHQNIEEIVLALAPVGGDAGYTMLRIIS